MGCIFQNKSVSQKQPSFKLASSKLQIIKKRLSETLARFSKKNKNNNNNNKTIIIIMKKEEKKKSLGFLRESSQDLRVHFYETLPVGYFRCIVL